MTDLAKMKKALEQLPIGKKAAQLRLVMPEVEKRLQEGVSYQAIVEALSASGLALTVPTFKTYLYRWRKSQEKRAANASSTATTPTKVASQDEPAPSKDKPAEQIRNKGDLAKLRTKEYDLDELAKQAGEQE